MKKNLIKVSLICLLTVILCTSLIACDSVEIKPSSQPSDTLITFMDGSEIITTRVISSEDFLSYIPLKEGYTFEGWYYDSKLNSKCETFPSTNTTLFAKWVKDEVESFLVVFKNYNGEVLSEQNVNKGEAAVAPKAPVREGYTFEGWNLDFTNVQSDLTILPKFKQIEVAKHTLSIYDNKNQLISSQEVQSDKKISPYINSVLDDLIIPAGFTLDKLYVDAEHKNIANVNAETLMGNENRDFYIGYEIAPITGLDLSVDKESIVYSNDAEVLLTCNYDDYSENGITYTYEWNLEDSAILTTEGEKTFTVKGADVGRYTYKVTVYASVEGMETVSASTTNTFEVTEATINNVTIDKQINTYNGVKQNLIIKGLLENDVVSYKLKNENEYTSELSLINVGIYNVDVKIDRNNYKTLLLSTCFEIVPAVLNIKVEDKNVKYGDNMPEFTYNIQSGLVGSDNRSVLTGEPIYYCTQENTSKIGDYPISIRSGLTADNYIIKYIDGTLTINKANLIVTANDKIITYGDNIPKFDVKYEGLVNGDTSNALGGILAFACDYTKTSPVNIYSIMPSGLTSYNYNITYNKGTLFVGKAELEVNIDSKDVTYGDIAPTYSFKPVGFLNKDDETLLKDLVISSDYKQFNKVGEYAISANNLDLDNYTLTINPGKLTVKKKDLKVVLDNKAMIYGDKLPAFTLTHEELLNNDSIDLASLITITTNYNKSNVGNYVISANPVELDNYSLIIQNGQLTVNRADLIITANDVEVEYGDPIPLYTAKYDGLQYDDMASHIGQLALSCSYAPTSDVGSYEIKPFGLETTNYNVTFKKGSLNVKPVALVIKANDATTVYGSVAPSFSLMDVEFKNNEDITCLDGTLDYDTNYVQGSRVGTYDIVPKGLSSTNYVITFEKGSLVVTKKALNFSIHTTEVNVEDKYNIDVASSDKVSITGLYENDLISGILSTNGCDLKEYVANGELTNDFIWSTPLDITRANESYLDSYEITYNLYVQLIEKSFDFDAKGSTTNYDGLNHTMSIEVLTPDTTVTYSVDDVEYTLDTPQFKDAGKYKVYYKIHDNSNLVSDLVAYVFVTINKIDLTVTANNKSITYGDALPAFDVLYNGFIEGENEDQLLGSLMYTCDYSVGNAPNDYNIIPSGLDSTNYNIIYANGTLSVIKKALTIKANDVTLIYGDNIPNFTVSYEGLISDDDASTISGDPVFSTNYNNKSVVGEYDLTVNGLSSANYKITYKPGTIIVDKKPITIIANDKKVKYGDDEPIYDVTYDSLINGDLPSVITGLTIGVQNYSKQDKVGTKYNIEVSGAIADNYSFTYENGILEIVPQELIVKTNPLTILYGEKPNFTANITGFVNGDDKTVIKGTIGYTDYKVDSGVGTYDITPNGLSSDNYVMVYEAGLLTVTPVTVDVKWTGLDSTYECNSLDQQNSITAYIESVIDGHQIILDKIFSGAGTNFNNAGDYVITASTTNKNYVLSNNTANINMAKGTYGDIVHSHELTGTYDPEQNLGSFVLDNNFRWENPSIIPNCSNTKYTAIYNADPTNYNDKKVDITLKLDKATIYTKLSGSQNIVEFNYSSNVNVVDIPLFYKNVKGQEKTNTSVVLNYSNGNKFTDAGTYVTTLSINDSNYKMVEENCYVKVKGVKIGQNLYTVEDALHQSVNGNVIVIANNTAFANFDTINEVYPDDTYYTVKSGTTLLVPYEDTYNTALDICKDGSELSTNKIPVALKIYKNLTIPTGITLKVQGILTVNAERTTQSNFYQGHTYGNHGQITILSNAQIKVLNGGTLNSNGYIIGEGMIEALSGAKVYDVLAIKDWRGGSISTSIHNKVFPFNQYLLQNIECYLRINNGASYYGRYFIYAAKTKVPGAMIIAGDGATFDLNSGCINKYLEADGHLVLELNGNLTTNTASLKIPALIINVEVSTKNVEFPIPGNMKVVVKSGSNLDVSNRFKFLPGSQFIVEENAKVRLLMAKNPGILAGKRYGQMYAFGVDNPYVEWSIVSKNYSGNNASANARDTSKVFKYDATMPVEFVVDGTFQVDADCTVGAAFSNTKNTGKIIINGATSATINENVTPDANKDPVVNSANMVSKVYINSDKTSRVALGNGQYAAVGDGTWKKI